jgi:histidine triad (HIT) family protein
MTILSEVKMSGCLFCSIIEGDVPSHKIYENQKVLAFLDINPSAPGHTLVIPKTHVARLEELTVADAEAFFMAVHRILGDIQEAMDAPSSTIGINNGPEAGQEVPHLHLHIIPRKSRGEGGIIQGIVGGAPMSREELGEIAEEIRQKVGWSPD